MTTCDICGTEPGTRLLVEKYPERNTPAERVLVCEDCRLKLLEDGEYEDA
jgi:hypothetical protein